MITAALTCRRYAADSTWLPRTGGETPARKASRQHRSSCLLQVLTGNQQLILQPQGTRSDFLLGNK